MAVPIPDSIVPWLKKFSIIKEGIKERIYLCSYNLLGRREIQKILRFDTLQAHSLLHWYVW
jgi:hypothetical protein